MRPTPSFEVWLVLHFGKCTKYGIPDEMTALLDSIMVQRRGHRYEKSKGIGWTEEMVDTTLKNAAEIQKKNECTLEWCSETKPSTMVHELVKTIRRGGRGPPSPDAGFSVWSGSR